MVTLEPDLYYLDDWDKIASIYKDYIDQHAEKIQTLSEWIKKEPHLPSLPDPSLGVFLKISNESTEVAKESIEVYFTHRTRNPDMFTNRLSDMKRVEQTLDLFEIGMPELWAASHKGCRMVFFRIVDTDSSKLDFHKGVQILTAVLDFEIARVGLKIAGTTGIIDMTGFHLGYLAKLNVTDIACVLKYAAILENFISDLHVINCNSLISQVMTIVRPFLSKNLLGRIFFYNPNQINDFYKAIPKSCVTSTFGGELDSLSEMNDVFRKRFRTAEDWLKKADSAEFQIKENLRRVQTGKEVMNGSFRKLCID